MSLSPRTHLLAGLACVLLALAGCAADEAPGPAIPEPPPLPPLSCAVDQDCPDPAIFFCDTVASRCEPACRIRTDCARERRGQQYALPQCDDSPLGCQCDMSRCMPAVCAADADCAGYAGTVCRDGACIPAPAAETAAACEVTPDVVVGRPGLSMVFHVWARDARGAPVVPRAGVTWQARSREVTGGGEGVRATFVLAEPGVERDAVEARVGNVTCRARVTVLPAEVPPGGVRVLAVDELTGRPLPLATVAVSNAAGVVTASAVTGPEGAAWVPATGEVSLSVFHADYGYLTLAGHDATGTRDLRLALRRNPLDRFGGVRGTFADPKAPEVASLRLALTGLALPGLPSDAAPQTLLGPEREVQVGAGSSRSPLRLPSSVAIWLAGTPPLEVAAPGVAGVCDAPLADVLEPELGVRTGACGTRVAWALTGELPLRQVPLTGLQQGGDALLLLGRVLPWSQTFESTVLRDTRFTLASTPLGASGEPDLAAVEFSRTESFAEGGVRLAFPFAVRVPALPRFRGLYLNRAYVLATVQAPGRGRVPLGLGAAPNLNPRDPNTDWVDNRLGGPGLILLRMAPAHGGLEGQPYRLVVSATSGPRDEDAASAVATTTLLADLAGPTFDPPGARPVELRTAFLQLPEDARYNFDTATYGGLAGRQFRADVDAKATLVRVVFTTRSGRRWTVVATPQQAREGLRVPRVPAPFEDRTYSGDLEGSRASLLVEVLTVTADTAPGDGLGPARLAAAEGPGWERLGDLTRAMASLDVGRPEVAWLFPELEGQRLVRGSAVRVRVTGFRVGPSTGPGSPVDGQVRLVLRGGTGCEGTVLTGDQAVPKGDGEVELQLPPGCSGTGVRLVAELADPAGIPLRPPVTAVRGVDIP
ncbi:carboxypeptidase regulatory-like domain-containing protein [Pyxidicoccus xibeiensis]|uniref:carboxypeptidase regulatory-like domain-containing protein n=1 Tax=Pyxidicoccus xibeiensis TaxID=2906759 RepID=UPI0020A70B70|nr:carboxypeptidase regulatory-like domain-containing protein [Pyxidicoccus xibeiensis]MCP3138001.1 carboxypeptidase regulatory-like domain-containing protein [Pyxidicoccus xibeiensis]